MSCILVIDDEKAVRDSCSMALSKGGYEVETAEDGETGLGKVQESKPDLVLIDLKMPGIDGIEVMRKIRDIDPGIVSIVITGFATVDSAVESMKQGAYDFLPKPFTPIELHLIVERGLEKRRLALEAAALREEKRKMEENFITLVSHELRAHLADIHQYFDVILGGITGRVPAKQKKMLQRARDRVDVLLKLTDDWLDMARIKRGKMVERFAPLDICSLLARVVDFMRPQAEMNKIALEMDSPADPQRVEGDRLSLRTAFTNLISNGIRFNHEGGSVLIKVKEQGNDVVIEVSDSGIGIREEDIPFVFDEFFRVRNSETHHIAGSGLGLSITKKIVEAHCGSIRAESEIGKGTTFQVVLPKPRE